jgi:hypothetical protein
MEVSGKVPGEAEKWDDVIRKITSVWTPEVAAEVLAAITKLDLRSPASVGDVPTFDGSKFVPQAVSGGGTLTVVGKAASYALQPGDTGKVFVATAGDVVFGLPVVASGLTYTMVDLFGDSSHPTIVRPGIGERIFFAYRYPDPAMSKGLLLNGGTPGQAVTLVGMIGQGWIVVSNDGTINSIGVEV